MVANELGRGTPSVGPAPSGFGLRVPEAWVEFDVWRATRTGDLARLLDARIAQSPELKPYRGALLKALREAAGQAERNGALFCAAMTDLVEDAGMLAATVMVFQSDPEPDPANDTPEMIAGRVNAVSPTKRVGRVAPGGDRGDPGRAGSTGSGGADSTARQPIGGLRGDADTDPGARRTGCTERRTEQSPSGAWRGDVGSVRRDLLDAHLVGNYDCW
ncbi:MAG: hypothetical protein ACT4NY_24060 [Pseudonocardiales bacterium]